MEGIGNGFAGVQNMTSWAKEKAASSKTFPPAIQAKDLITAAQKKGFLSNLYELFCCCFQKPLETHSGQAEMEADTAKSYYAALKAMNSDGLSFTFDLHYSENGRDRNVTKATIFRPDTSDSKRIYFRVGDGPDMNDSDKRLLVDDFSLADFKKLVADAPAPGTSTTTFELSPDERAKAESALRREQAIQQAIAARNWM